MMIDPALLLHLGLSVAVAGSGDLKDIDRQAQAVRLDPDVNLQANPQIVAAAVQALKDLQASVDQLPEELRDAGTLRLVEAYHALASDLFAVPCPSGLDAEQCVLFRGAMGEQVQLMLTGVALHAVALEHSDTLSRRDRARLDALGPALEELSLAVRAAVEAMPKTPAPPPRPEVGSPQPLPDGWIAPTGESGPDARFAVIRGIADLRNDAGEPLVELGVNYEPGLDDLYAVELLGRSDGRAELRLGGVVDWDAHCVPHQTLTRFEAVRAWAPEEALLPILAQVVAVEHDDGTGFRLLPGAPVVDGSAWVDGQLVPVSPDAQTGRDYGSGQARLERIYSSHLLAWDASGTIGDQPFSLRQPDYDHGDALAVSTASARGEATLVTLTEKCGELRFLTATPTTEQELAGVLGGIGGLIGGSSTVTVPSGSIVYWADGQPAGQLVSDLILMSASLFGDDLRCLERKLGSAESPKVPVCFDPAALERE
jgi:hypothetical protein